MGICFVEIRMSCYVTACTHIDDLVGKLEADLWERSNIAIVHNDMIRNSTVLQKSRYGLFT